MAPASSGSGLHPCCSSAASAIDSKLAVEFTENGKAVIISDALGGVWQWMVVLLFLIALILAISPVANSA